MNQNARSWILNRLNPYLIIWVLLPLTIEDIIYFFPPGTLVAMNKLVSPHLYQYYGFLLLFLVYSGQLCFDLLQECTAYYWEIDWFYPGLSIERWWHIIFHMKETVPLAHETQSKLLHALPHICRVGVCFGVSSFSLQCRIGVCRHWAGCCTVCWLVTYIKNTMYSLNEADSLSTRV